MSSERTLVVRGIPSRWTEKIVELFFDDDRHCPDGQVEKVELAADAGRVSATVTFKHASGNFLCCIASH